MAILKDRWYICFLHIRTGMIKYHNIRYKNLFKISGRRVVNDSYDQNVFEGVYNIFKKNTYVKDRDYYYTCFYKISHTSFEKYHIAINNMLINV